LSRSHSLSAVGSRNIHEAVQRFARNQTRSKREASRHHTWISSCRESKAGITESPAAGERHAQIRELPSLSESKSTAFSTNFSLR
jgi:hypothetical protein